MPPPRRCAAIAASSRRAIGSIQADAGLVEQPERARAGQQAGEVGAPLLARRQEATGRAGQPLKVEAAERVAERSGTAGEDAGEADVLGYREQRLDRIRVADELQPRAMLRGAGRHDLATPAQPAGTGLQKSGQQAQQRGLAGAVRAAEQKRVARLEPEAQSLEHEPAAAHACEVVASKRAGGQGSLSAGRR